MYNNILNTIVFSQFLLVLHAYGCEIPRPFTHPDTRCPKKKRVEGRVEHGTSKSNIYSLLLLVLHVHCLLVGALVRCFIAAAHDGQIAPPPYLQQNDCWGE